MSMLRLSFILSCQHVDMRLCPGGLRSPTIQHVILNTLTKHRTQLFSHERFHNMKCLITSLAPPPFLLLIFYRKSAEAQEHDNNFWSVRFHHLHEAQPLLLQRFQFCVLLCFTVPYSFLLPCDHQHNLNK
jgi:hypothetical protein